MTETTLIVLLAAITAMASFLTILLKSRHSKRAIEELKAEKALQEYVKIIENRVNLLEHHVNECEKDRDNQGRTIEQLRDQNFDLMKRMVENLMENNKPKKV